MKNKLIASGIVVEYNPFHNGHHYHIQKAREFSQCDVLIAVMSPHFVQRGEPAFVNKSERTEAALNHGVDLVVELPTCFALQSADYFAKAAIEILALLDVDTVVFGSETNDLDVIMNQFNFEADNTKSYAKQMGNSKNANDILAYHYILNAKRFNIKPISIQRTNNYHSSDLETISSASSIRTHFGSKDVSLSTPMDLEKQVTHRLSEYEELIRLTLINPSTNWESILLVNEGIENLLIKNRRLPLKSLISESTSSRYTSSRIQRTLMTMLLNIKKEDVIQPTQVRILGMNAKGQQYLKQIKNSATYPVTPFKNYMYKDLEIRATEIYALVKDQSYQDMLNQKEIQELIIKK